MSSRDKILSNIKSNQPELVALPEVTLPSFDYNVDTFIATLKSIGGEAKIISNEEWIQKEIDKTNASENPEAIETGTVKGLIGVAENGAIWIDVDSLSDRAIPFICQHLAIVLPINNIVPTMHHAYAKIDVAAQGFGVFIAGPSKTADIEQSLVTGAHGARSLMVYLIKDQ